MENKYNNKYHMTSLILVKQSSSKENKKRMERKGLRDASLAMSSDPR